VIENGNLLVVKHKKKGRSWWCLPGGGLEPGETLEACVQREIMEETGLRIRPEKPIYLGELILPYEHLLEVAYHASIVGGSIGKRIDREVKAVSWVPLKGLRRMNFLPREIANRLEKDRQAGFTQGIVHLGRYKE
jgi:ADP-ribose pyrophosphatase YjhB (NUDIX family)